MPHVLLVEDNESTNQHLANLLRSIDGVDVTQAFDRESAERAVQANRPDLAVVDIDLGPGIRDKYAGWSLFTALNAAGCTVIIVSGMPHAATIKEMALGLNAYDFLTKPVSDLEFIGRVERALAWKHPGGLDLCTSGRTWPEGLTEDPARKPNLRWKGKGVNLTLTELSLVYRLIDAPGTPVSNDSLAKVMKTAVSAHALATHMTGIRRKFLDVDGNFDRITSAPGKGYVWKTES